MNKYLAPLACPTPAFATDECITLAHGEAGRLMRRLIAERILPQLGNPWLAELGDAAKLPAVSGPLAFTTDSYVVSPLFFPGGDIGKLAVFGTVNDLAVSGAQPLWLSLSFIIEEGLPFAVLERVVHSIAQAVEQTHVQIVAGDTKVVPRGATDGLFINTSGIGRQILPLPPGPRSLQPGDRLIVSGPIGSHGISILACRDELAFDPPPQSDCASLACAAEALREASVAVRAMRDATRGGIAGVLHEWAEQSGHTLTIDESDLPVAPEVRGACELLGLDPLHSANEGTMLVAVAADDCDRAVNALQRTPVGRAATLIGQVRSLGISPVTVRRTLGVEQPLDEPLGSLFPRIC